MRPALAIFAAAVLGQWLVPLFGVWQHERVTARGVPLKIPCAAPDPYDPFRGRYLAVRPEESRAPKPAGMPDKGTAPVWATLVAGDDGLSRIESLSLEPVTGPHVIRLVAKWQDRNDDGEMVFVEWPFDRLYLNERLALGADKLVAERFRESQNMVAEIRLLEGRAVLTDVLIDGVSIREVVKQQAE